MNMPLAPAPSPEKATCLRCSKHFTRRRGNQRYCSPACSAYVRNRRYYATPNGRQKKRAAQTRHFLRNPQLYYDARKRRIDLYAQGLLKDHMEEREFVDSITDRKLCTTLEALAGPSGSLDAAARHQARWQLDFHPSNFDGPRGRWLWVKCPDGIMRRRHIHAPVQYVMGADGQLVQELKTSLLELATVRR